MRTIIRVFSHIVVIALFISAHAWAYKPGPDIIRECPQCKTKLVQHSIMSGNTFGARFWTDGKMVAPMLPERPWLVKCPKCNSIFWIDDAKKLGIYGTYYRWNREKRQVQILELASPNESDYLHALQKQMLPKKKELYIRKRAWWLANERMRTDTSATNARVVFSQAQVDNLKRLATLLEERIPAERIIKAEIFRELGQFEVCIKLLSIPFQDKRHADLAAYIRQLAEMRIRAVREIIDYGKTDRAMDSSRYPVGWFFDLS
jgi:hypothetical protein